MVQFADGLFPERVSHTDYAYLLRDSFGQAMTASVTPPSSFEANVITHSSIVFVELREPHHAMLRVVNCTMGVEGTMGVECTPYLRLHFSLLPSLFIYFFRSRAIYKFEN